jgi:hypothetical protein
VVKSLRSDVTFELVPVQHFDARRGYVRCRPPGLRVQVGRSGRRSARADLWRDPAGRLVVRLLGVGDAYSYEARLASGETIPDAMLESATDWLSDVMAEWIAEGLDDAPEPGF